MKNSRDRVFNIIKRVQGLKYRLVLDSLIVGLVVGIIIVIHRILLGNLTTVFEHLYSQGRSNLYMIPIIFITLIVLGYIVSKMVKKEPMISGSGIPQVEGILSKHLEMNWFKVLFYKFIGGLICLGAGLSVGREGPSVQMGASAGEGIAKGFKKLDNEEKYLITSGASAGLSAAFNAPLSGVMFALEEAHKNFSPLILLSAMIASLTADFVSKQFFGIIPSLHFSKLEALPLKYYWALIILGAIIGVSGVIFNKGILKTQKLFKDSKLKIETKIIIPFIVAGVVGLICPILLGGGHDLIISLQDGNYTLVVLMTFIVVKFLFTFVSFGSSVPGGIFFPLLVLGALVGNVVGLICINYLSIPPIYIMNFVVLAMAGHFAAIVKAPITAVILISEMTGSLDHMLSLAIVVVVAQLMSDILNGSPIYESLLERLLDNGSSKYQGSHNKKTLLEIAVHMDSEIDGKFIKEIQWPRNSLVVSIIRGDQEIIAKGNTKIMSGDYITIIADQSESAEVLDRTLSISSS